MSQPWGRCQGESKSILVLNRKAGQGGNEHKTAFQKRRVSLEQGPGFIDRRLGPAPLVLRHAARPVQANTAALHRPATPSPGRLLAEGCSAPTGDSWLLLCLCASALDTAACQRAPNREKGGHSVSKHSYWGAPVHCQCSEDETMHMANPRPCSGAFCSPYLVAG